jgi:hypothetical protein
MLVGIVWLVFFSCKSQQKVKLSQLYEKYSDQLNGYNYADTSKTPSLALTKKKAEEELTRKKRIPKTTFYDIKTRRAFVKRQIGMNTNWEIFYVLKKYQKPDPLIKDIYWLHRKKRILMVGNLENYDPKVVRILHGPYLKKSGKKILEEGIFYVGTKHGRWVNYDRDFVLIDKKKFYKGYPTAAEMTYYDSEKKKLKEVIPIQLERKEGVYYLHDPQGNVLRTGLYKDNVKVGIWTDFYPNNKKKRETLFARDPYTPSQPQILKEYDPKGKLIFDSKKDGIKIDSLSMGE